MWLFLPLVFLLPGVKSRETQRMGVMTCPTLSLPASEVISLGDSRSYYLSTAENELGVVQAKSSFTGEAMVPVSWQEMACPTTQQRELRKVAKVT